MIDLIRNLEANHKKNKARLFPSLKASNAEGIATSIFLSLLQIAPEILVELLNKHISSAKSLRVSAYTEVDFTEHGISKDADNNQRTPIKLRPDGILIAKARNTFCYLVEVKVGNNKLEESQLINYLSIAKEHKLSGVLTISNEFTQNIETSPVSVRSRDKGKLNLLHLSWRNIYSTVNLMNKNGAFEDSEKQFLVEELLRFLRDETVGKKTFDQMPPSFQAIYKKIHLESTLREKDPDLIEVSQALVQEFSEIALILTDKLGVDCQLNISKRHLKDNSLWITDICKKIANDKPVVCRYSIPDAAENLSLEINFQSSVIKVGMEIEGPKSRTTNKGKINWLRHYLQKDDNLNDLTDASVSIRWNSRKNDMAFSINEFNPETVFQHLEYSSSNLIKSFTPMLFIKKVDVFNKNKKFIETIETAVIDFYERIGQNLVNENPNPPKVDRTEQLNN